MEKQDKYKVSSIVWRLNGIRVWDTLKNYMIMDLFVCLLLAGVFIYGMDIQMLGAFSLDYDRCFVNTGVLRELMYQVKSDGALLYEFEIGSWVYWLGIAGIFVLIAQLLDWFSLILGGAKQVRRQLRPLDEMAAKAKELTNLVDESKYQDLEKAIDGLKGDVVESGIHMHDRELRGIEQALNSLLERIRESYGQQTRFVSDASHELRTPIAVIQGYVNMLDRWGKEDEVVLEESIEAIKNEADHMQKLVEQLLFLARGDSNRQNLDMKMWNLADILEEIYEESRMIDEAHVYRFEKLADVQILGDFDMLKQSVRILVDNAVKYTGEGEEIILRVGVSEEQCPFYEIQDNGIGMSQQDVERAFDRFYRADAVRNSRTGGTGLGLSIARWITDQHGGRYEILSVEGLGTRFHVEFKTGRSEPA